MRIPHRRWFAPAARSGARRAGSPARQEAATRPRADRELRRRPTTQVAEQRSALEMFFFSGATNAVFLRVGFANWCASVIRPFCDMFSHDCSLACRLAIPRLKFSKKSNASIRTFRFSKVDVSAGLINNHLIISLNYTSIQSYDRTGKKKDQRSSVTRVHTGNKI